MPDFSALKKKLQEYASSGEGRVEDAPMEGVEAEGSPIDYLAAGAAPKVGEAILGIEPTLMNQIGQLGERNLIKGPLSQPGLKGLQNVNVIKGDGKRFYDTTPTLIKGMEGPAEGSMLIGPKTQIQGPSTPITKYNPNYSTPSEQNYYKSLKKKLGK